MNRFFSAFITLFNKVFCFQVPADIKAVASKNTVIVNTATRRKSSKNYVPKKRPAPKFMFDYSPDGVIIDCAGSRSAYQFYVHAIDFASSALGCGRGRGIQHQLDVRKRIIVVDYDDMAFLRSALKGADYHTLRAAA